jgi:hypothetical protein
MLLSKIVEYKVRNSTKCQDGLDGWVDNGLQKGPFILKVDSWLLGFSIWIGVFSRATPTIPLTLD